METLIDLIYRFKASCVANELEIMTDAGLSPAEYNGIAAMKEDETVCGNTVSQKMHLSPSRSSRVIEKMVQHGYLKRETDKGDRRKCNITLAKKGIEIKNRIKKQREACDFRIREHLTDEEIEFLTQTLNKLIQIMG